MNRLLFLMIPLLLLTACGNTWDSEAQDLFRQGCINSAKKNDMPEDKAKAMCDCRLEKAMEMYPSFADAMDNVQDIINDPKMKDCEPKE